MRLESRAEAYNASSQAFSPPCDIKSHMAYVGTVSFCDANGEALEIRRYASPACDDQ